MSTANWCYQCPHLLLLLFILVSEHCAHSAGIALSATSSTDARQASGQSPTRPQVSPPCIGTGTPEHGPDCGRHHSMSLLQHAAQLPGAARMHNPIMRHHLASHANFATQGRPCVREVTRCMAKGTNARKRPQLPFQQTQQASSPKVKPQQSQGMTVNVHSHHSSQLHHCSCLGNAAGQSYSQVDNPLQLVMLCCRDSAIQQMHSW